MGNYLKKPIIDEAVQSGRLGTINYASNTIQVSNIEFGLDLAWSPCYGRIPSDGVRGIYALISRHQKSKIITRTYRL